MYINIGKIITDINIDISSSFGTQINDIYNRYYKYQEKKIDVK